jgi:hypothetical protein
MMVKSCGCSLILPCITLLTYLSVLNPFLSLFSSLLLPFFSGVDPVHTQDALDRMNQILTKVDEDVLNPDTEKNLREAMAKLNSSLTRIDNLLAQAERGQGLLAKLLSDKKWWRI